MSKLVLSAEAARRIVESGSVAELCDLQRVAPPVRGPVPREGWECRFTNEGRWRLEPGEMVGVVGMVDAELPSGEAIETWRSEGLRLRAKRIGNIDDANSAWLVRGVALDEIAPGETGRGVAPGAFMALVWRDPAVIDEGRRFLTRADWKTVTRTDPDGVSRKTRRLTFVKYPGDYTVVDAAVPDEEDCVFGLITPALPGPFVDEIASVDPATGTALLTCGVAAASPLRGLTASDVGRQVLLTRDTVTRAWYILVADGT